MPDPQYQTVAFCLPASDALRARLHKHFKRVLYYPDSPVPQEEWSQVEIWFPGFGSASGLPPGLKDVGQVKKLSLVQLASAGAESTLNHPLFQTAEAKKQIRLCNASGIHVYSIPQYIISNVINLYMKQHLQLFLSRKDERWFSRKDFENQPLFEGEGIKHVSLYGKTAGILGYGHIGRETARVLKAMNVKIIAANTKGDKKPDEGYIVPNTGDPDGSIPEEYYSTSDPESFAAFLRKSEILIASLPGTPATTYFLKREHFALLPPRSVFVNVGRGNLCHSDDVLHALNQPDGLGGAVLDVTDPEPLPSPDPLYSHPRCIITSHTSGDPTGYFDAAGDVLIVNAQRLRKGRVPFNVVDPDKGY